MGSSVRLRYRVELMENVKPGVWVKSGWKGRPSEKRLAEYVESQNQSFLPGQCNFHVSKMYGVVLYAYKARVIDQNSGEVVAEYSAPAFQAM